MPNDSEVVGWPSGKQPLTDENMAALEQRAIDSVRHDGDEMTGDLKILAELYVQGIRISKTSSPNTLWLFRDAVAADGDRIIVGPSSGAEELDVFMVKAATTDVRGALTVGGDTVAVRATGSYTGDGVIGRTISLPFTPTLVVVHGPAALSSGDLGGFTMTDQAGFTADSGGGDLTNSFRLNGDGFRVAGSILNTNGETYYYTAIG